MADTSNSEDNTAETMAKILNLCEADPDAGLKFIESVISKKPEAESNPFGKFAKAMAYGSKGLFQLARSKPKIDFTGFDEEELRDDLGIIDTHLDYLEKGLQEIRKMEEIHHGALKLFGRDAELKVDVMAMVLERCRPGRVQEILEKTKLWYFGADRIKVAPTVKPFEEQIKPLLYIFFSLHSIVRSVIVVNQGKDAKGRKYIECMMYKRSFNDLGLSDTFEKAQFADWIYLFDDGTFGRALPEEHEKVNITGRV